jgi:YD repeat-containing protein
MDGQGQILNEFRAVTGCAQARRVLTGCPAAGDRLCRVEVDGRRKGQPLVLRLAGWRQGRRWCWPELLTLWLSDDDVLDMPPATARDLVHGRTRVGAQVEAIGDLDGVGRALLASFRIRNGAIANDDLHARVLAQPIGEYVGGAIVEQVDRTVRLEVNQQRAVAALFASQGHVVDTQHAWTALNIGVDERMQNPQKCVRTDRDTHFAREASAAFAAALQSEGGEQFSRAVRAAGVARQSSVEALGEGLQYDNEDRLTQASAPAPVSGGATLSTSAAFDAVGNRLSLTDANGQITRYLYDVRDSLKEVDQSATQTDPNADSSKIANAYSYDNLGNLVRVDRATASSSEEVVDYAYDGVNRVRKETQYPQGSWPGTPNGSTGSQTLLTQTTYDPDGNRQTLTDPLAQLSTFSYDALNRPTGITYTNAASGTTATPNVSYGYDANSNRASMVDGSGSTSYTYDELDRLLSVTSPGPNTVGYRYDLDGNRRKLLYPDGTAVNYTFDAGNRLQSFQDWASHTTSYNYFPDGLLNTITNLNGTTGQFTYDNARRLTQVLNQQGTTTISQHGYSLDAVGNRTQLTETPAQLAGTPPAPPTTYASDAFGRTVTAGWGTADTGGAWTVWASNTTSTTDFTFGALVHDAGPRQTRG